MDSVDIKIDSFFFEISIPHHHRYRFRMHLVFCYFPNARLGRGRTLTYGEDSASSFNSSRHSGKFQILTTAFPLSYRCCAATLNSNGAQLMLTCGWSSVSHMPTCGSAHTKSQSLRDVPLKKLCFFSSTFSNDDSASLSSTSAAAESLVAGRYCAF